VTEPSHRPKSHRDYGDWPPSRIINWATTIGPHTGSVVEEILAQRPHPEQGYRSCLALFRDSDKYGHDRMEAACKRALTIGSPSRKSVEMILKRGLDRLAIEERAATPAPTTHENVRGAAYYDTSATTASATTTTATTTTTTRRPPTTGSVH